MNQAPQVSLTFRQIGAPQHLTVCLQGVLRKVNLDHFETVPVQLLEMQLLSLRTGGSSEGFWV